MKSRTTLTIALFVFASTITIQAQTSSRNPMAGTWKLDTAKSKFSPGPAPKGQTAKIESVGGGMKVTIDRMEPDGKTTHIEWMAKFDGKDYPVNGDPSRDSVSAKKVDDYTINITNKKAGKVTTTIHAVYARDGKTRTETVTGTDAQGKKINNVTAWDRQ